MAPANTRYSLRSKGKASASAADEKATAPLVSDTAQPDTPPKKKTPKAAGTVQRTASKASSKALGKRKRADTLVSPEDVTPPEPTKEYKELEKELAALKPLGEKVSQAKCHRCQHSLFPGVNLQQHLEAWTSRSGDRSPVSVVHCPSASCSALTCIGCGLQPALSDPHSHSERRIFKSFNHKPERASFLGAKDTCCSFGCLASVWVLLSYFDDRFAPGVIGKPEAKGGSRPAKAKKSSKKKSGADRWPKGVGYASGYDDFDDYMPPAFPPSSCKGLEFKDLDLPSKTPDGTDELTKCLIRFLSDAIQDTFATLSAVHDELIKEAPSKRAKSKAKNDAARRAGESPSASSTESGKAAMSDMLAILFSMSWFPAALAELLRNDSIEAATDRSELYTSALGFIDSMLDSKDSSRLVTEGYRVKSPGRSLSTIIEEGDTFFRTDGLKPEKTATLVDSTGNLLKASRSLLASARQAPSIYSDDSGKQQLELCKRVELTGGRIENHASGGSTTPSKQSTAASTIERLELIDEKALTARYAYGPESNFTRPTQPKRMRVLFQEVSVLTTSLPEGVFLKVAMNRPDLMKALVVGPENTPYEGCLFEFDILCPEHYPNQPPKVSCSTAAFNGVRLNPNLYENGYVCLSLINTWSGAPSEQWQPGISTLLQVLVSIQSMIFVRDPGENEPGGSGNNTTYNRKIEAFTTISMISWLTNSKLRESVWRDAVTDHFKRNAESILITVRNWAKSNPQIKKFQKTTYPPSAFAPPPPNPAAPSNAAPSKPPERDLLKELEDALTKFL